MPKLTIAYCLDIMEELEKRGFDVMCPHDKLEEVIQLRAGWTRPVIDKYISALIKFGFIKSAEAQGVWNLFHEMKYNYR